jgi:Ca2+-binding EF-hand superfamily protein
MTLRTLLLGSALFCLPALAFASTTPTVKAPPKLPTADELSKAEANIADAAFAKIDSNGDGQLSKAEFTAYMNSRLAQQRAEIDAAFKELDTNKDGKVSKEEANAVPALAEHFTELDFNHDGSLSKDEMTIAARAAQIMEAKK